MTVLYSPNICPVVSYILKTRKNLGDEIQHAEYEAV
jgi:hypothetical protein